MGRTKNLRQRAVDRGLVVSLCDRTGNIVRPWIENGYRAITVDLKPAPAEEAGREHIVCDVARLNLHAWKPVAVFAQPPCTDLASSGARWFKGKGLAALIAALQTVEACRLFCEASGAPWMIENPVGTLATYWREADHTFDPCDFGDPYTKTTCLWTGGGFVMPPVIYPGDMFEAPTWTEPTKGSAIHVMPETDDRPDKRAETPPGFARAVYLANAPHLKKAPRVSAG